MKKNIYLLGILLSLPLFGQQNILVNSGFEERNSNTPDDWYTNNTSSVDQNSSQKKTGGYSLRMTSQQSIIADVYQNGSFDWDLYELTKHEVTPNQNYELSYWVLDNTPNAQLKHIVKWKDENNNHIATADAFSIPEGFSGNHADWKLYSFVGKSPANAKYVEVVFQTHRENGNHGGSIFLDDVSLKTTESLAVSEITKKHDIKLSNTLVNENFRVIGADKGHVEIYGTDGRKFLETSFSAGNSVYVSELKNGFYFVRIKTENETVTHKIIKK